MKLQALQTKLNQSCKKKKSLYIYRLIHDLFHIKQDIPETQLRADMGQQIIAVLM